MNIAICITFILSSWYITNSRLYRIICIAQMRTSSSYVSLGHPFSAQTKAVSYTTTGDGVQQGQPTGLAHKATISDGWVPSACYQQQSYNSPYELCCPVSDTLSLNKHFSMDPYLFQQSNFR